MREVCSQRDASPTVRLSVVIPVKDRPDDLAATVATVLSQSLAPFELIIVDQSRSQDCVKAVQNVFASPGDREKPKLIHLHKPEIDGLAAARNEGVRHTAGSTVIFLDDDVELEPDAFLLLAGTLGKHPHLLAVGGIITNYKPPQKTARLFRSFFYRGFFRDERQSTYWNWSAYGRGEIVPTGKLNGGCMAIRREALAAVGGFDERYCGASVGEDVNVSLSLLEYAGRSDALALVGGACLTHHSRGQWKRNTRALELEIVAAHYLYQRYLSNRVTNTLRFLWMMSGILLMASTAAIRRGSLGPLRSVAAAVRCIREGYRGCPFLKAQTGEPNMGGRSC